VNANNFGACGNGSSDCVQCRNSSDCPSGLKCNTNDNTCVPCRTKNDCALGLICEPQGVNDPQGNYHPPGCFADCRTASPSYCNPGLCDGDAGECLFGVCTANWQCVVNGQGACDFGRTDFNTGYFTCAACYQDAGCGQNELCVNQGGRNVCQLSCLLDPTVCSPGTFCGDAGLCQSGCQNSIDCAGSPSGPICHQGQCVGCLTGADCPASNPGCGPGFSSANQCGFCQTDSDCPSPLHCETNFNFGLNQCRCHSDSECDPLRAPSCIGLDVAQGFPQGSGQCGCATTNDCPSQTVCELRSPYGFTSNNGNMLGGGCIPACTTTGTDCTTAGITSSPGFFSFCTQNAPPNNVCDVGTGYCVPCAIDLDCQSPVEPKVTPGCAPFQNGSNPFAGGVVTGGGLCACTESSQCDDGNACLNPGIDGHCGAPCSYVGGVDSCAGSSRGCPTFAHTPYCNTFTGGCQGCLSDHDCIGTANAPGFGNTTPTPLCDPVSTACVQCISNAGCPAYAPNCTQGFCGFCQTNADCLSTGGWQCVNLFGQNQCAIPCVPNAQELPTDAGASCPSTLPYCAHLQSCSFFFCQTYTACAECRPDFPSDCPVGQSCSQSGVCQ
jgi:hypothetical protein